jgi:CHRD domain-containing protein/PEP-CTERM motif-containing protein
MKLRNSTITRLTAVLAALALSSTLASATIYNFTATLNGANEVGPTGSLGTGSGTFAFDDVANNILGSVSFTGLGSPATLSHIHVGAPGANGGVIVSFVPYTPAATSGLIAPGIPLAFPVANIPALFAGNTYFNIHTGTFPGGEIRGQLVLVPEPGTLALAGLGSLGLLFWRKRQQKA